MQNRPRWLKVLSDLWLSKTRTLLVVLSIAVGVFAVGMVANTYIGLIVAANEGYAEIEPASGFLSVLDFDEELIDIIENMPSVRVADGQRVETVRLNLRGRWYSTQLSSRNYEENTINLLQSISGAPVPGDRELLIDQTTLFLSDFDLGETVVIETADGRRYEMAIAGTVRDMNSNPSINSGGINAYINRDTFEWLGASRDFNQMTFIVAEKETDFAHVQRVIDAVKERVEESGYLVLGTFVLAEPGVNPVNFLIEGVRIVLGVMAFVSLALSAFLVFNTMSALIISQTKQIGIMKSVGATVRDLIVMYLTLVVVFGLLAFLVAVAPAAWAANAFTSFMAGPSLLDLRLEPFRVPPLVIGLELLVSILAPILGSLPAVISGARVTVNDAISTHGLGGGDNFGSNLVDRMMTGVQAFTGPLRLSVGNVLRNKQRVVLTLGTLVLGGAVFVGVLSVRESAEKTVAEIGQATQFDVQVTLGQPYRIDEVSRYALQVPGVVATEGWTSAIGALLNGDKEGNAMRMTGVPIDSELVRPKIITGRWLQPGDTNAIVIDTSYLRENPDARLGETIRMRVEGRDTEWQIVGIYQLPGVNFIYEAYTNYDTLSRTLREPARVRSVQLITEQHGRAYQERVSLAVNDAFRTVGLEVTGIETSSALRSLTEQQFDIVIIVLFAMSALMMLVGGLGLAGTMSMSVLERTREIGVMRAVGASNAAVTRIIIVEGVLMGVLSWFAAVALGWPVGIILSQQVGQQLVNGPLSYVYSINGAFIWLVMVLLIAVLASYAPARRASRLTVRDVLAYE